MEKMSKQAARQTQAHAITESDVKLDEESVNFTQDQVRWLFKKMNDIRNFEDEVHRRFLQGEIIGFVHLYAGEEAIAAGVGSLLNDGDFIASNHRGHGHCIAKGCDIKQMMAEIYGKKDGLCNGKGGSMHIADIDKGMLGANGMVGGGFGLGLGAAMRNKYLKNDNVTVVFFGDGASNIGNFHEVMNMAKIWNAPVVFVCENNYFAQSTPSWYASASDTIADRAIAYNMPSARVDGKDVVEVYTAAKEAIEHARNGEGPSFLECVTYRNYGHYVGDEQKYKKQDGKEKELADTDPIEKFRDYILQADLLSEEELDNLAEESQKDIEAAVQFAEDSPEPDPEALYEDVLA